MRAPLPSQPHNAPDHSLWQQNLKLAPFQRIDQAARLANDLAWLRQQTPHLGKKAKGKR